jgi:hypothetical protein
MPFRILAVAIGNPAHSTTINTGNPPAGIRNYINGLITYLGNPDTGTTYNIGTHYSIDYYECYEGDLDFTKMAAHNPEGANAPAPDVIFCMSTPIVRAARDYTRSTGTLTPVVGVFSDAHGEGFDQAPYNICGVNADRIRHGWHYYNTFDTNYRNLDFIYVLHRVGNTASKAALALITAQSPARFKELDVATYPGHDIVTLVKTVPAGSGLLVLPVDLFFGAADQIHANVASGVPVFWPTRDFAKKANLHYGVSQLTCGKEMAKLVQYIFDNRGQLPGTPAERFPPALNPD